MYTSIRSFDSVVSHLELAILSRKFRITEHMQSTVVKYFNLFSAEFSSSLQKPEFSSGYGHNTSKGSNLLRFSIFRITPLLDPFHRRLECVLTHEFLLINIICRYENVYATVFYPNY